MPQSCRCDSERYPSARTAAFLVLLIGALALLGCKPAPSGLLPESEPASESVTAESPAEASPPQAQATVARIVFVGQQEACKCARTRIDVTWKALQAALEGRPPVPVEQITMDQDEDDFDRYDEIQSLIVPPGIYFFDADGELITLLQGEQSKQQILTVLDPGAG